ncbi:MAG: phage major capsid protein [Anaerolineae bacterium]
MQIKAGARHSKVDQEHLDQAAQHLMDAGATTPGAAKTAALKSQVDAYEQCGWCIQACVACLEELTDCPDAGNLEHAAGIAACKEAIVACTACQAACSGDSTAAECVEACAECAKACTICLTACRACNCASCATACQACGDACASCAAACNANAGADAEPAETAVTTQSVKRAYSTEERQKLAADGKAKPDGSYPIVDKKDLQDAIDSFGRGGATQSDKEWIVKRAKELDATDLLPTDWAGSTTEAKTSPETLIAYGGAIKALGDGRVGGYLVSYGSPVKTDLTGVDWFSPRTDYGDAAQSDVYFHHGLPVTVKRSGRRAEQVAIRYVLKKADLTRDDVGVFAQTILDMRDEYEKMLYEMAAKSKLSWSSGTLPHLVVRDDSTGEILKWPLGLDASLTPTPAESDEKNNIRPLKNLKAIEIEALPEVNAQGQVMPAATAQGAEVKRDSSGGSAAGDDEMTPDEIKTAMRDALGLAEGQTIPGLVADEVKKLSAPPVNGGGAMTAPGAQGAPAFNKTPRGDDAFKAFNWFLKTGDASGIRTGEAYAEAQRLQYLETKTNYQLLEGTQYQGQEAVPTEVWDNIVQKRDPLSVMRAGKAMVINAKSNAITIPIEKASPQAWGITTIDGSNTFTTLTQQPIDKLAATLYMYTYNLPFDIQLIDDATFNVEGWGSMYVARGLAITENTYLLMGTGSGQPQGAVYAGTTGVTAASATAVTAAEVMSLYYKLPTEYQDSVIWTMATATHGAVRSLGAPAYGFAFAGNGGFNGGAGDGGFPNGSGWLVDNRSKVFTTGAMDSLAASHKPISVMNPSAGYALVDRKGLTVLRDPYSQAAKGLVNVWFYARFSGGVVNATAIQNLVTPSA